MGAFSRDREKSEVEQIEVEFEINGQTYRVRKDRDWLLRGADGAFPTPIEEGHATIEQDLISETFVIVNWGVLPLVRILTDD